MARPGSVEYDTPDGSDTRGSLQRFSLHRAAELCPDLLTSLAEALEARSGPFAASPFAELPDRKDYLRVCPEWFDNEVIRVWDSALERMSRLEAPVREWQTRWGLADEWVRSKVVVALVFAREGRDDQELLPAAEQVRVAWQCFAPIGDDPEDDPPSYSTYVGGGDIRSSQEPQPDEFVFSARWYPQLELRSDVTRWLKRRFEKELKAYLDSTEAKMEASGLVKSPEKRPRLRGDWTQHLDWLIRFQLQRCTHAAIAKSARVGPKTVAAGCVSAAKLINLTRRSLR